MRRSVWGAVIALSIRTTVPSPSASRPSEHCLRELEKAQAELVRREQQCPRTLSADERSRLLALGGDLLKAWQASTTSPRDKKELLRECPTNQPKRELLNIKWRMPPHLHSKRLLGDCCRAAWAIRSGNVIAIPEFGSPAHPLRYR